MIPPDLKSSDFLSMPIQLKKAHTIIKSMIIFIGTLYHTVLLHISLRVYTKDFIDSLCHKTIDNSYQCNYNGDIEG
jgi:hypothetical protein